MTDSMFRFRGRAVLGDDEGYYFVRWDRADDISVLAKTRKEANRKAFDMLGPSSRRGWSWRLVWDRVDEELVAND